MIYLVIFMLALALTFVPYAKKYLALINTFVHESGHALFTLLSGGRNQSIALYKNGAGLAIGGTTSRLARFIVLLAGYTTSSSGGYGLLYALHQGYIHLVFWIFTGLIIVNLLFWVRNWFGFLWLLSLMGIFAMLYFYSVPSIIYNVLLFFVYILCIEALKSSWVVFKLSFKTPTAAGDATYLREATKIPAIFWGFLFFAQGCFFAVLSILVFIKI